VKEDDEVTLGPGNSPSKTGSIYLEKTMTLPETNASSDSILQTSLIYECSKTTVSLTTEMYGSPSQEINTNGSLSLKSTGETVDDFSLLRKDSTKSSIGLVSQELTPIPTISEEPTPGIVQDETYKLRKQTKKKELMSLLNKCLKENQPAEQVIISLETCLVCNTKILPGCATNQIKKKFWHAEHFKCKVCNVKLTNETATVDDLNVLFCKDHYVKADTCAYCELPIQDSMVDILNQKWHVDCFRCTACDCVLTGNFVPYENLPYCRSDYLKRAGLICGGCGEFIEKGNIMLVLL
jgi:hypothetical protein